MASHVPAPVLAAPCVPVRSCSLIFPSPRTTIGWSRQQRKAFNAQSSTGLAERQIDALGAHHRMLALGQRRDAVIGQTGWTAPDDDVAMGETVALLGLAPGQATEQEGRRQ